MAHLKNNSIELGNQQMPFKLTNTYHVHAHVRVCDHAYVYVYAHACGHHGSHLNSFHYKSSDSNFVIN